MSRNYHNPPVYRCPWCGKKTFSNLDKARFGAPDAHGFHAAVDKSCHLCGGIVSPTIKFKELRGIPLVVVVFAALFLTATLVLLVLSLVFPIFWLRTAFFGMGFLTMLLLVLHGRFGALGRLRYGSLSQERSYDPELYEAKLSVSLDKTVHTHKERVYAFKLNGVTGEMISKHIDTVNDYNHDGVTAIFEKDGRLKYTLDVIHPEYYNGEFFEPGAEFEVYNCDGDVIAVGRIEQLLTDKWPVKEKKRPTV